MIDPEIGFEAVSPEGVVLGAWLDHYTADQVWGFISEWPDRYPGDTRLRLVTYVRHENWVPRPRGLS